MPVIDKLSPSQHKRSTWVAQSMYLLIMGLFLTICVVAVTTTMAWERENTNFRPITVKKPISFLDTTYMPKPAKTPEQP